MCVCVCACVRVPRVRTNYIYLLGLHALVLVCIPLEPSIAEALSRDALRVQRALDALALVTRRGRRARAHAHGLAVLHLALAAGPGEK